MWELIEELIHWLSAHAETARKTTIWVRAALTANEVKARLLKKKEKESTCEVQADSKNKKAS